MDKTKFTYIYEYMSIKRENKEARINLILTKELRKKYKVHCAKKDIGMSERIRELIERDLAGKLDNPFGNVNSWE